MGVSYLLQPLDAQTRDWVENCGVPIGDIGTSGRPATLAELNAAAGAVPGHDVTGGRCGEDQFEIQVLSHKRTSFKYTRNDITYRNPSGRGILEQPATEGLIDGHVFPDDTIKSMFFRGSARLMLAILRELTKECGPYVFYECGGWGPWVVLSPESTPIGKEPAPSDCLGDF